MNRLSPCLTHSRSWDYRAPCGIGLLSISLMVWLPSLALTSARQGKLGLLPGSSMLSVSIWRLKGSVGELSRCRRMIERSMMVPEGSLTGSVIRVSIRGSVETEQSTLDQWWGLILKKKSRQFLPARDSLGESYGASSASNPYSKGKQQMMKADEGLALPSVAVARRRKEQRQQQAQSRRTLCLGMQTPS